jgi:hypothetical protein
MEHRRRTILNSLDDDLPSSPDLSDSETVEGHAIYYHNKYEYKGTISEIWIILDGIVKLIYWKCYRYMM